MEMFALIYIDTCTMNVVFASDGLIVSHFSGETMKVDRLLKFMASMVCYIILQSTPYASHWELSKKGIGFIGILKENIKDWHKEPTPLFKKSTGGTTDLSGVANLFWA